MPQTKTRRRGRRRLTPAEWAERRERDRKRLEQATRELLSSEGWKRWIAVRRQNGLARYTCHNQMLLACEAWARQIEPSYVAGYRWWQANGYQVRKGEKALSVLAPIRRKVEDEDGEKRLRVVGFRGVPVFDRAQVDAGPDATPLMPPVAEPITGSSHAHLVPLLEEHARKLGCRVSYEEELGAQAGGFYRDADKLIAIRPAEPNRVMRTLLHELGHAMVAREKREDAELRLDYAEEECVVECTGHIAAAAAGLDTSGEAISYCASWGESDNLESVSRAAQLIDRLAGELEQALGVHEDGKEEETDPPSATADRAHGSAPKAR